MKNIKFLRDEPEVAKYKKKSEKKYESRSNHKHEYVFVPVKISPVMPYIKEFFLVGAQVCVHCGKIHNVLYDKYNDVKKMDIISKIKDIPVITFHQKYLDTDYIKGCQDAGC